MANVRINDLTADATPSASDVVAIDGATTRKATLTNAVSAGLAAPLSSIEGLATSADQMLYLTGADVYATTALTPFARTLLDDADAATMRATLGAVIGTDVQAWDADLDTLAANGLGTTGLALLADETPADARDTIDAVVRVANRTALKALDFTKDVVAIIYGEGGRNGRFAFDDSDLSTEVTADTQEGVYVAPDSDATGTSGAWVRQDGWAVEGVSPKWYGATGDGVTDDTVAMQAALDSELPVRVPAGIYILTSSVTSTDKDVSIVGTGTGEVELRWTADGGFNFDMGTISGSAYNRLNVRGVRITTTTAGTSTGLYATYTSGVGANNAPANIQNVEFAAAPGFVSTAWWQYGIQGNNVRQSVFRDVLVRGSSGANSELMLAGIYMSDDNTETPVELVFDHCSVYFGHTGYEIGDLVAANHEGIYFNNCVGIANRIGIRYRTANASPWMTVVGCHLANTESGIYTENISQVLVANNNFSVRDNTTHNWAAIRILRGTTSSANNVIHGNYIRCNKNLTPTTNGVETDASNTIIIGNAIASADTGIHLMTGSSDCQVTNNSDNNNTTPVLDEGSNNFVSRYANNGVLLHPSSGTGDRRFILGSSDADHTEIIDLVGDTTHTSFGLRIQRRAGANTGSRIHHRGTGGLDLLAQDAANINFLTNNTLRWSVTDTALAGQAGRTITIGGTQVVQTRETGWTASTGTANKGAYATYSAPDIDATYNEAQIQALADAVQAASQRIKALEDALFAHGLIGA